MKQASFWRTDILPLIIVLGGAVYLAAWHIHYLQTNALGFRVDIHLKVIDTEGPTAIPAGARIEGIKIQGRWKKPICSYQWLRLVAQLRRDKSYLVRYQTEDGISRQAAISPRRPALMPKFLYSIGAYGVLAGLLLVLWIRYRRVAGVAPMLTVVTLGFLVTHGLSNLESLLTAPWLFSIFLGLNLVTPPLLFHLFLNYPSPLPVSEKKLRRVPLAYLPQTLVFAAALWGFWVLYDAPSPLNQARMEWMGDWMLPGANLVYAIAAIATLSYRFWLSPPKMRRQLLWLLYGVAVFTTLTVTFFVLKWNAGSYHWMFGGSDFLLPLYSLLAFTIGFSFISFRLVDVDRIVNKSLVYALLSGLVAGVYLLAAGLFGLLVTSLLGGSSTLVTVTATVLATALFFPLRRLVQKNVDRIFFRDQRRYAETVQKITSELVTVLDLQALLGGLLERLIHDLRILHASALLLDDQGHLHVSRTAGRPHQTAIPDPGTTKRQLLARMKSLSSRTSWVVKRTDIPASGPAWSRQALALMEGLDAQVIVFLSFQEKVLGLVALGPRHQAELYTRAETAVLESIAPAVSLAIRNAKAYTDIGRLNKDLQTKQREILELQAKLRDENRYLREAVRTALVPDRIIANSPAFQQVLDQASKAASSDATILLLGETGVGKDVVARLVHEQSPRATGPLVTLNCAAIPANLLESELFGHERGAFTGAVARKPGKFELADGGTLFLDEIGDMPQPLQSKLLRVLEDGRLTRVGGTETIDVDVRIVAATNRNLEDLVAQGLFRQDLYYRLAVVPIAIPPLRERGEDIEALAEYFLKRAAKRMGKRIEGISDDALDRMKAYHWPGNVRELANAVERAVILATSPILDEEITLPGHIPATGPAHRPVEDLLDLPLQDAVREFKRLAIRHAIEEEDGNKSRAAQRLGVQRTYLHRLIGKLGL